MPSSTEWESRDNLERSLWFRNRNEWSGHSPQKEELPCLPTAASCIETKGNQAMPTVTLWGNPDATADHAVCDKLPQHVLCKLVETRLTLLVAAERGMLSTWGHQRFVFSASWSGSQLLECVSPRGVTDHHTHDLCIPLLVNGDSPKTHACRNYKMRWRGGKHISRWSVFMWTQGSVWSRDRALGGG